MTEEIKDSQQIIDAKPASDDSAANDFGEFADLEAEVGTSEVSEVKEAVKPEEKKEEVKPEVKIEKPKDEENAERSRLGRELKKTKEELEVLKKQIETMASQKLPEIEAPDTIVTADDMRMVQESDRIKAHNAMIEYQSKFIDTLENIKVTEEEEHLAIYDLMLKKYNKVYTKDPVIDAELNYDKAAKDYYAELVKKPKPKTKAEDEPAGVSVGSNNSTSNRKAVALDKETQDLAKELGLSEEEALDAVSSRRR
jgi:hypothetical protein